MTDRCLRDESHSLSLDYDRGGKNKKQRSFVQMARFSVVKLPDLIISLNGFLYRGNSEQQLKQPHNSMGVGTMTIPSS